MIPYFLILLFALGGCGYSVVDTGNPFGKNRLAVMPFSEEVPLGISADLTQAMITQLASGGVIITSDLKSADAIFSGRVTSASTQGSPTPIGGIVPSYRVTVNIEATLVDLQKKELWRSDVAVGEDFLTSSDPNHNLLATESNRRRAIIRLAQTAAKAVYQRFTLAGAAHKNRRPFTWPVL
jgi:hypothetical protein